LVLGVFFLGQLLSWDGTRDQLLLGATIALVIAALTLFLAMTRDKPGKGEATTSDGNSHENEKT
jgi:hypothetical protein